MDMTTTTKGATTMTETTKVVRSYGRIDAMRQAEEIAREQGLVSAVATSAKLAATSKAERAINEARPERTQWLVTVSYDLLASAR